MYFYKKASAQRLLPVCDTLPTLMRGQALDYDEAEASMLSMDCSRPFRICGSGRRSKPPCPLTAGCAKPDIWLGFNSGPILPEITRGHSADESADYYFPAQSGIPDSGKIIWGVSITRSFTARSPGSEPISSHPLSGERSLIA